LKAQISLDVLEKGEEVDYEVAHDPKGQRYTRAKEAMLWSKNRIKHMDDENEKDHTITIDPKAEARRWIEDAWINFDNLRKTERYAARLSKSPTMWMFDDYEYGKDE
jgi:hypothetical protein